MISARSARPRHSGPQSAQKLRAGEAYASPPPGALAVRAKGLLPPVAKTVSGAGTRSPRDCVLSMTHVVYKSSLWERMEVRDIAQRFQAQKTWFMGSVSPHSDLLPWREKTFDTLSGRLGSESVLASTNLHLQFLQGGSSQRTRYSRTRVYSSSKDTVAKVKTLPLVNWRRRRISSRRTLNPRPATQAMTS